MLKHKIESNMIHSESESELDFSFAINSVSNFDSVSESDPESDPSLVFINLDFISYPDSIGHVLSIIKLVFCLWIKSFEWYVLGNWSFLTCKKRRQNHPYPFCDFNKFHEVFFHFLHEFFFTQCNAMAPYLISPLHCIHNG